MSKWNKIAEAFGRALSESSGPVRSNLAKAKTLGGKEFEKGFNDGLDDFAESVYRGNSEKYTGSPDANYAELTEKRTERKLQDDFEKEFDKAVEDAAYNRRMNAVRKNGNLDFTSNEISDLTEQDVRDEMIKRLHGGEDISDVLKWASEQYNKSAAQ